MLGKASHSQTAGQTCLQTRKAGRVTGRRSFEAILIIQIVYIIVIVITHNNNNYDYIMQ